MRTCTCKRLKFAVLFIVSACTLVFAADPNQSSPSWTFAVSGDSRNCGDVVMPAIAAEARKHDVAFYWHLGDLRAIYGPDQDYVKERSREGKPTDLDDYLQDAWDDFIANQVNPWGDTPFYLGIGNHETVKPKTREQFVQQFREYLDRPDLKAQRLKDNPSDTEPETYYHWVRGGVDFMYLDNASRDQFDSAQMKWIKGVLDRDRRDASIRTLVVGMHAALPESISANHSMNEWPLGVQTGRQVYQWLLGMQKQAHKNVYVLASHSHFFMDGTYNTAYWKSNGGVLPGWIVGTAGAERYPLPPAAGDANAAKTGVYGYLLATVNPPGEAPGTIKFNFEELKETNIPDEVVQKFTEPFIHECFVGNQRKMPIK